MHRKYICICIYYIVHTSNFWDMLSFCRIVWFNVNINTFHSYTSISKIYTITITKYINKIIAVHKIRTFKWNHCTINCDHFKFSINFTGIGMSAMTYLRVVKRPQILQRVNRRRSLFHRPVVQCEERSIAFATSCFFVAISHFRPMTFVSRHPPALARNDT